MSGSAIASEGLRIAQPANPQRPPEHQPLQHCELLVQLTFSARQHTLVLQLVLAPASHTIPEQHSLLLAQRVPSARQAH
jgi:hypothetical protein